MLNFDFSPTAQRIVAGALLHVFFVLFLVAIVTVEKKQQSNHVFLAVYILVLGGASNVKFEDQVHLFNRRFTLLEMLLMLLSDSYVT